MPPSNLSLNCLMLGDSKDRIFNIKIKSTTNVTQLQKTIREAKHFSFKEIDISGLDIWAVDLRCDEDDFMQIFNHTAAKGDPLGPLSTLSGLWTSPLDATHVHVIVGLVTNDGKYAAITYHRNVMGPVIKDPEFAQDVMVKLSLTGPAPSTASKVHNLPMEQQRCPILYGRPVEMTGLPIGLYSPIFDEFTTASKNATSEVSSDELAACSSLCAAAVAIYATEADRREAMREPLQELLGGLISDAVVSRGAHSDGVILGLAGKRYRCYRAIFEWKNDGGTGGCDGVTEGCLSYRNYWTQPSAQPIRKLSNCPGFIIAITGPWLVVLGAVLVEAAVFQLLDYQYLGVHPVYAQDKLFRIVRLFAALKLSLRSLKNFYKELHFPPRNSIVQGDFNRFFPYILSYPTEAGNIISFRYLYKLAEESPTKAVFAARTENDDLIVVKYAEHYNADAHRCLADLGLAPLLLYAGTDLGQVHGNIAGLHMIVMEFIDGETVHDAPDLLTDVVLDNLSAGIYILHEHGFVFGDLRPPNIVIDDDRVSLVDFDWCAECGVGRYPASLSEEIEWHPDVKRNGVMKKEHDLFMLRRLVPA